MLEYWGLSVHLPYQRLKISLEKTISESNDKQGCTSNHQKQGLIGNRCRRRDGQHQVTYRHQDNTGKDGTFVITGSVGNNTTYQCKNVNRKIKC